MEGAVPGESPSISSSGLRLSIEGFSHLGRELLERKRLLDEAHPLMDNPLLGDDLFGIPGHKQTLHLRADLPQPLDQEASVHLRHDDIGNEEVNLPLELRRDAESLARARGA